MESYAENKSLHVGNLSPNCTEAMLFGKFSSIGSIVSLRICRDTASGTSLGHAYVNFAKHEEAETALKKLNHEQIDGMALRIMWAQKDLKSKLLISANLVVKNFDRHMDDKLLMRMFSNFGKVLSVKVANHQNVTSKGYGFVQFENEASAQEAISYYNGKILRGRKLAVSRFIPTEERQKFHQMKYANNVFMNNLAKSVTNDDRFILPEEGQKFHQMKHANNVFVKNLSKSVTNDDRFIPSEEGQKFHQMKYANNVFVKNLAKSVTNDEFEELCNCFGDVWSAKVITDKDNESKGYGFVSFISEKIAIRAVEQLNRLCLHGKILSASITKPKSPNKA